MGRPFTCRRASASRCFPSTAQPRSICSIGPIWRCTRPSAPARATPSSARRRRLRPAITWPCCSTCATVSTREELVLDYQPKIDLATGAICGVEALVRWRHPKQGLLAPARFMPEVERTHLIAPVTRWVLNTALRQQRVWRDAGIDLTMAVNVSARSLRQASSLPDTVAELTQLWGTGPGRLTLELTEGALIGDAAPAVLPPARDGRDAVDRRLRHRVLLVGLPAAPAGRRDQGRQVVRHRTSASASDDAIIVRSTIDLAHNLGLTVVAEGVEDGGVVEMLARVRMRRRPGLSVRSPDRRRGPRGPAQQVGLTYSARGGGRPPSR